MEKRDLKSKTLVLGAQERQGLVVLAAARSIRAGRVVSVSQVARELIREALALQTDAA